MLFTAQQLTGDPAQQQLMFNWLFVLLGIAVLLKKLLSKPEKLPQPMVTQKHPDYVPRHEFTQLQSQVSGLGVRIETVHKDLLAAGEDRAKAIHERLNLLLEQGAELKGRVAQLNEHEKKTRKA